MQKTLIAIIILALVGAGLYYVLTQYRPNPDTLSELNQPMNGENQEGGSTTDAEVRGTVVAVNTEQAMVDGPVLVMITTEAGETAVIAIPSMGLPLCAARETITDPYQLQAGQVVGVRGAIGEEGVIIPCESSEHYLAVVEVN